MLTMTAVCKPLNLVGHAFRHRTLNGIKRRAQEPAGDGWTWVLRGTRDELRNLGAYLSDAGWILDVGYGWLRCEVVS